MTDGRPGQAATEPAPGVRGRECFRCGRVFLGKAGRLVDGKPACPACGNALRPPVPCIDCGRMAKHPARSSEHGGLICAGCRDRDTHATCRRCGRHRRVARRDAAGRPLCAACAADPPAIHPCPDCGLAVPGSGKARCMPCGLARRVARQVEAEAAGLRQAWVRELFVAFCGWNGLRRERGSMARHVGEYARFFAVMDRCCGKAADVHQASLLEQHGAEGLRRAHQPVRFLVGRLALPWDAATAAQAVEGGRVAATIAAAAGQPWATDLDAYRMHLSKGRALAPATARMYLAAAAGLLLHAGVEQACGLTPPHVARHLQRTPGQAANLRRFLSWVGNTWGQAFSHKPKRRPPPRRQEKATLRRAGRLIARLEGVQDQREGRAVLAAAIAVLHHVPLARVLALQRKEVTLEDGRVVLWPAGKVVELAQPLAAAFARFAAGNGRFPFPGRNGVQPLTTSAIWYYIRKPRCGQAPPQASDR